MREDHQGDGTSTSNVGALTIRMMWHKIIIICVKTHCHGDRLDAHEDGDISHYPSKSVEEEDSGARDARSIGSTKLR